MYPNPLFPEIVSTYKARYKSGIREDFFAYCRTRRVAYKSVCQWMRRRGQSVASLRLEALLELAGESAGEPLSLDALNDLHKRGSTQESARLKTEPHPVDLLKGVTTTFPDGLVVTIRQTTGVALTKFIDSYNQLNDREDV